MQIGSSNSKFFKIKNEQKEKIKLFSSEKKREKEMFYEILYFCFPSTIDEVAQQYET